jgi:hypothetical protein
MRHRALAVLAVVLLGVPATTRAQSGYSIEWADRPGNPNWMLSDPVFQRTLSCWREGQRDVCQLIVVTISRGFCPAVITADAFRTDVTNLTVTRTPNAIDLEFTDLSNTWTIHLEVIGKPPIVERASGVVVTRPLLPQDAVRSSELVALVQGTDGFNNAREFADVELKCGKVSVVAAKKKAN